MTSYTGTIEIGMGDFWDFVSGYTPNCEDLIQYGVPRVNKDNQTIEIDFAASTECDPAEWANEPDVMKQWKGI